MIDEAFRSLTAALTLLTVVIWPVSLSGVSNSLHAAVTPGALADFARHRDRSPDLTHSIGFQLCLGGVD